MGTANQPKNMALISEMIAMIINGISFFTVTSLNFNAIMGKVETIK